jgi:DNA polymerase (family 10)
MLDNYAIADNFSLQSILIEIHCENSFKAKSYATAAYIIEKLPEQLSALPEEKISTIKGIGEAMTLKIKEQLATRNLEILNDYLQKTPAGVVEKLHIKGLGPKKIHSIWKQLEIESIGELLYACNENRLTLLKGCGAKTQASIKENIDYYLNNQGHYLYQQAEAYIQAFHLKLTTTFQQYRFELTGAFIRQFETVDAAEWITNTPSTILKTFFTANNYKVEIENGDEQLTVRGSDNIQLIFYFVTNENWGSKAFIHNSSPTFINAFKTEFQWIENKVFEDEATILQTAGIPFIPACRRENATIITHYKLHKDLPSIKENDIKGNIHCHSNWSDGVHTLEHMANAVIKKGLEYMGISDHSKSAFYANGLTEERVLAQHEAIDALNKQLAPFKIFKSIESDILNDGALDYPNEILQRFDIVIASIHSNLKMSEEKAMKCLLKAIQNPFTSILGHLTGRLLLSRKGYPVDHSLIIEACAKNNVVIELNAHPRRLDIDWLYIDLAFQNNVLISIEPDAHAIDGFDDCKYGILVAQKTLLTPQQNLSSCSLQQFEAFVAQQHKKSNI